MVDCECVCQWTNQNQHFPRVGKTNFLARRCVWFVTCLPPPPSRHHPAVALLESCLGKSREKEWHHFSQSLSWKALHHSYNAVGRVRRNFGGGKSVTCCELHDLIISQHQPQKGEVCLWFTAQQTQPRVISCSVEHCGGKNWLCASGFWRLSSLWGEQQATRKQSEVMLFCRKYSPPLHITTDTL